MSPLRKKEFSFLNNWLSKVEAEVGPRDLPPVDVASIKREQVRARLDRIERELGIESSISTFRSLGGSRDDR